MGRGNPAVSEPPRSPRRWRLALGSYADRSLGGCLGEGDARVDAVLDRVYGEAYRQRGLRRGLEKERKSRRGGSEASRLAVPDWLGQMRTLFPRSVCDVVQGHAIARFGMTDILKDEKALAELRPDPALLGALMAFKGRADPGVAAPAKDIAWTDTIRRNLKHYDPERRAIIAANMRFHGRVRRHLPWTVVLCVDQSGSMAASVIYAAVMAAILAGLPAVVVKLVVFDTGIVDLSGQVADPVEVLMSVQLGGGTDIGRAMAYCETTHVTTPERTILVLVSDFCEGAAPGPLLATVRRLAGARVTLLGLAALDEAARPDFDRDMAKQLAAAGMHVAALTPEHFADWIAARLR